MSVSVSIIVAAYNEENNIRKCLDSIRQQTTTDIEIIVVDDGSMDSTGAIIDEYQRIDQRVKPIHKKNGGPSSARNMGLDAATGKYVAFVDSDDYIDPNMIEVLLGNSLKYDADITACGYCCETVEDGAILSSAECIPFETESGVTVLDQSALKDCFAEKHQTEIFNPPWAKLYRRDLIERLNARFDESLSLGEDLLFNLQLLRHVDKYVFVCMPAYHYVIGGLKGLTSKYRSNMANVRVRLHNSVIEQLTRWGIYDERSNRSISQLFFRDIIACFRNTMEKANKKSLFGKVKEIWAIVNLPEVRETVAVKDLRRISMSEQILFAAIKYKLIPILLIFGFRYSRQ